MEFRILGPLEVVEAGRLIALGGSRQRALLALLLTRANEVVSTDRLIDALWGARPPKTAANSLQYHVSQLRKSLAPSDRIVTRERGYLIRVEPDELDLARFERLVECAQQAVPERGAELLREALALWRGAALADLSHESLAQGEIARLDELRLAALERRLDADLAIGRSFELVGELEALAREHPLRERLRAQLMLALYRSGRQAEALDVYRETRRLFVDELGIEPGPALQELEKAVLRHDVELESPAGADVARSPGRGTIVVAVGESDCLAPLLAVAEPLAREPSRELILVRLLRSGSGVAGATAELAEARLALTDRGVESRVAAYTSSEPGEAALLADQYDADLLLVAASEDLVESERFDVDLTSVLERAPCDVGLLAGSGGDAAGPVVVPFGGADHDWSAVEVAAWLAGSLGTTVRLLGTEGDPARGKRDASRLLAKASLLVQEVVGIVTEPLLVAPGEDGVLEAASGAYLLVVGLSDRWRTEGIGPVRRSVAMGAGVPILFVRRGIRPSGVAPSETLTRFTWTLASEARPQPG
jgi:DNA-binding SARP family transcriptional activator